MKTGSCTCEKCVKACKHQPGWFAPGEAENAAEFLGVEFEKFSKDSLIKDHCSSQIAKNAPYVWAPRKRGVDIVSDEIRKPKEQWTEGDCIFLFEDRCSIYPVRPFECRKAFACDFKEGARDKIENMYIEAGAPLGMRPEPSRNQGREQSLL